MNAEGIQPTDCKLLEMRINPVGYRVGQEYPCQACGAAVLQQCLEDNVSPETPQANPAGLCPYSDAE